jgi:O-antigen ligase
MPSIVALFLCFGFIAFAYRIDIKCAPDVSSGLWVPLIWILILGSRPVSLWFGPAGFAQGGESSPLDATIYSILIGAAWVVLSKREICWREFFARNRVLILLFLYMAISMLWSEAPFSSFKRFIKMIGMPMMVLVVLTERDPVVALATLARRFAYVLIPLSETLNKYFFSLAVHFDDWTGAKSIGGVAGNKNGLGQLCLIASLLLIWVLRTKATQSRGRLRKPQFILDASILYLAIYLLFKSSSSTSFVCFIVGLAVLLGGSLRFIRWRIATLLVIGGIVFVTLESTVGIYESLTAALGKDPTLTNRTDIWRELWALRGNSLVGTGFEGFWAGERLLTILQTRHINEAHNGYLEIFLSLGLVGLVLWLSFIAAAYKNCRRLIVTDYDLGRIGFTIFAVVLIYNFTESGIKGLSCILFFFFLIAMDAEGREQMEPIDEAEESFGRAWLPATEAASVE